ncbi:piggyBac transposable element-derived protein 3-like isoform X2 [Frankliniella occidentalis]|uniref:PiggyBac transposable element-derived protein 3-like isoform X2 n=1 Tax=Frankliniella occidentalis TaxID=133901 RepID=A0A9C6XTK8_FRAOC|nr:piggyBac transposable element-derived protein 3-like isoform X2 [Frankliniella occidentalis]
MSICLSAQIKIISFLAALGRISCLATDKIREVALSNESNNKPSPKKSAEPLIEVGNLIPTVDEQTSVPQETCSSSISNISQLKDKENCEPRSKTSGYCHYFGNRNDCGKRQSSSPHGYFPSGTSKKANNSSLLPNSVQLYDTFSPKSFSTPVASPASQLKKTSKTKLFPEAHSLTNTDNQSKENSDNGLAEPLTMHKQGTLNLRKSTTANKKAVEETFSSEEDTESISRMAESDEEYVPDVPANSKKKKGNSTPMAPPFSGQSNESESQQSPKQNTSAKVIATKKTSNLVNRKESVTRQHKKKALRKRKVKKGRKEKKNTYIQNQDSLNALESDVSSLDGDLSEYSETEDIVTATSKKRPQKQHDVEDPDFIWNQTDIPEAILGEVPHESLPLKFPIDYFNAFISDDILQVIVDETNNYSNQRNEGEQLQLTLQELKVFLGIWIFMGICSLPSYTDYWSGITRVPFVAEAMTMLRFKLLRARLHLVDNSAIPQDNVDPLLKVRPLLNHVRAKCNALPQNTTCFSIDESMSPYKGTKAGPLRQYIKGKPHKWGFKAFMLTSSSGIVYDFLVYCGSKTFELEGVEVHEDLGVGGNVVYHLCKKIQKPRISGVCFDNYFTSIPLICGLKDRLGLVSIGTIRLNRTKGCPLPNDKDLTKQGRGTSVVQSTMDGQVAVVKWVDNKVVKIAGSWAGRDPQVEVLRWDKNAKKKITVPCPKLVRNYNKYMGGVDLFDMLMHLYKLPGRAKRWPFTMMSFLIDLSLVNAFLLHRADLREEEGEEDCDDEDSDSQELPSKLFRLQIVQALVSPPKKVGRTTAEESSRTEEVQVHMEKSKMKRLPSDTHRLNGKNHLIVFERKKGRCSMCRVLGRDGFTFAKCSECNVMLCVLQHRNCFYEFHTTKV